jgi:hypothetical protein
MPTTAIQSSTTKTACILSRYNTTEEKKEPYHHHRQQLQTEHRQQIPKYTVEYLRGKCSAAKPMRCLHLRPLWMEGESVVILGMISAPIRTLWLWSQESEVFFCEVAEIFQVSTPTIQGICIHNHIYLPLMLNYNLHLVDTSPLVSAFLLHQNERQHHDKIHRRNNSNSMHTFIFRSIHSGPSSPQHQQTNKKASPSAASATSTLFLHQQ